MLIRLQSGFHFRRGIPVRFRPALGKREIWHSLETLDRNLARTLSAFRVHQSGHVFIGRNILAQQGN
ncbi:MULTISPECIES: DUF6538 domain-containing protein [Gluconobacter]|uniref:DUF6538 domain-containing protein n=1 Tax=Gluconobacter TaxID=441 RepID=UPI0030B82BF7